MPNHNEIQEAIQLFQNGNIDQSKEILERYIDTYPDDIDANLLSAAISASRSDFPSVVEKCRKVLIVDPKNIRANFNAAVASDKLNNHNDVLEFSSRILAEDPENIHAMIFHVKALYNLGKFDECITLLENITHDRLMSVPDLSIKLGECYMAISEYDKAILIFNQNISSNIKSAQCLHNIGIIESQRGNAYEAIKAYQAAIVVHPDSLSSNYNLAFQLSINGNHSEALKVIGRCYVLDSSARVRQAYVELLSRSSIEYIGEDEKQFIVAVIGDEVTNVQVLSSLVMTLVRRDNQLIEMLYTLAINDNYDDFFKKFKNNLSGLADDKLLILFFMNLPITEYGFEKFTKMLRYCILLILNDKPDLGKTLQPLSASIAIRCYIDGYVYTTDNQELAIVEGLINSIVHTIKSTNQITLSAIAMYVSLYDLYRDHDYFVDDSNHGDIFNKLVKLQLKDNLAEDVIKENIESPVEVQDKISLTVQEQYESNPYPVWQLLSRRDPESIIDIISKVTSFSEYKEAITGKPDILIAGCGTGSHAIQTAMRIEHASLTAMDLSKSSLAFAKRKANEYGFEDITFKQLDILNVSALDRQFDIIESVGVIHHMDDPLAGFKSLVEVLKPDGLMNIGLYSKIARRYILKAKSIYDIPDGHISDDEIRRIRVDIMDSDDKELSNNIEKCKDFFSLHDCRDLIFHENENNYDIPQLAKLIEDAGMEFVGFDLYDSPELTEFQKMFPVKHARSDLNNWAVFEEKFPDTFAAMYVFWCRKKR